jgi:hypothetical protein
VSHLARELDRQLVWIERQARELQTAVEQLMSEGNALMNDREGWDERQADTIYRAVSDFADDSGRYLATACAVVTEFGEQLSRAHRRGVNNGCPG